MNAHLRAQSNYLLPLLGMVLDALEKPEIENEKKIYEQPNNGFVMHSYYTDTDTKIIIPVF